MHKEFLARIELFGEFAEPPTALSACQQPAFICFKIHYLTTYRLSIFSLPVE